MKLVSLLRIGWDGWSRLKARTHQFSETSRGRALFIVTLPTRKPFLLSAGIAHRSSISVPAFTSSSLGSLVARAHHPTYSRQAVSSVVRISSEGAPLTHMERALSIFTSSSHPVRPHTIGRTLVREEVSRHKATPGKSRHQGFRTSLYANSTQTLQWILNLV